MKDLELSKLFKHLRLQRANCKLCTQISYVNAIYPQICNKKCQVNNKTTCYSFSGLWKTFFRAKITRHPKTIVLKHLETAGSKILKDLKIS